SSQLASKPALNWFPAPAAVAPSPAFGLTLGPTDPERLAAAEAPTLGERPAVAIPRRARASRRRASALRKSKLCRCASSTSWDKTGSFNRCHHWPRSPRALASATGLAVASSRFHLAGVFGSVLR